MRRSRRRRSLGSTALFAVVALVLAACGGDGESAEGGGGNAPDEACEQVDDVRLQLRWVTQAQFAGFFAAQDNGYYSDECLNVEILEGGPDIGPVQVVAGGGAEFGIHGLGPLVAAGAAGEDLMGIAQIHERSGKVMVSWAEENITTIEDLRGKRVGAWGFGNEYELLAALNKEGIDPKADLELVDQPFDMSLLLNREIDAAMALTYNEYAQLLETTNEDTGELYQPDDFNTISFEEAGTGMIEDVVFTTSAWLSEAGNEDIAVRFLRASFRGWIDCRDDPDSCVDVVLGTGAILGESHQRWMMNEVNKIMWPWPSGVGFLTEENYEQTATIAETYIDEIDEAPPMEEIWTNQYVEQAWEGIDTDTVGEGFEPQVVELQPGGE